MRRVIERQFDETRLGRGGTLVQGKEFELGLQRAQVATLFKWYSSGRDAAF
jgi:hypothetical protein